MDSSRDTFCMYMNTWCMSMCVSPMVLHLQEVCFACIVWGTWCITRFQGCNMIPHAAHIDIIFKIHFSRNICSSYQPSWLYQNTGKDVILKYQIYQEIQVKWNIGRSLMYPVQMSIIHKYHLWMPTLSNLYCT